jgi:hypothetical protein
MFRCILTALVCSVPVLPDVAASSVAAVTEAMTHPQSPLAAAMCAGELPAASVARSGAHGSGLRAHT